MQTAAQRSPRAGPRPRTLHALLIPTDPAEPATVITVPDSSRAISDVLGGCLLDDTVAVGPRGDWFTLYLADGAAPTAPDNPRAAALAARLGLIHRALQARIRGPVLIVGLDPGTGTDLDVPVAVVSTAARAGLTVVVPG